MKQRMSSHLRSAGTWGPVWHLAQTNWFQRLMNSSQFLSNHFLSGGKLME